jgi:hypothetical protein
MSSDLVGALSRAIDRFYSTGKGGEDMNRFHILPVLVPASLSAFVQQTMTECVPRRAIRIRKERRLQ